MHNGYLVINSLLVVGVRVVYYSNGLVVVVYYSNGLMELMEVVVLLVVEVIAWDHTQMVEVGAIVWAHSEQVEVAAENAS